MYIVNEVAEAQVKMFWEKIIGTLFVALRVKVTSQQRQDRLGDRLLLAVSRLYQWLRTISGGMQPPLLQGDRGCSVNTLPK